MMIEFNNKIIYSFLSYPSNEKYNEYIKKLLDQNDYYEIINFLKKNLILLRFIDKCKQNKINLVKNFRILEKNEISRRNNIFKLADKINGIAKKNNFTVFFPKLFIHYPDIGNDLDLVVTNKVFLKKILNNFSYIREKRSFINYLSSKLNFSIDKFNVNLEVHKNNIGIFGEFHFLKKNFFKYPKKITKEKFEINTYNNANLYTYFIIQRIYSHYSFRITDIIYFRKSLLNLEIYENLFNKTLSNKVVLQIYNYYNYNNSYPKYLNHESNIDFINWKLKIILVFDLFKLMLYRFQFKSIFKICVGILIYLLKK